MPYLNIANSTTVFTTTGLRLNIVTVSGPQGLKGLDGTGAGGIHVTGSNLLSNPNLIGTGSITILLDGNTVYFSGTDTSFSGISGILDQKIDTLSGFLYGTIVATGNEAINHADGIGTIISGNLTQSGITLMGLINVASGGVKSINGISGDLTLNGAGNVFVTNAGNTFIISGDTGTYANFATVQNLESTGQAAWSAANNNAINLSGNLAQTGVTLNNKIDSVSGWADTSSGVLNSLIIASGNAAISHSNTIGSIISGNLTATGQTLDNKINSLSGFSTSVISGGLQSQIAQTGTASISYSNSIASIISGNLVATGQLLSAVKITGSSVINVADFTGIGGAIVFSSGNKIFISGGNSTAGISTGVTSLNFLTGAISITGTGGLTVAVNGTVISISGDTSISGALTQTGVALGSKIDSVSGWALNIVSGGLETRINQSGTAVINFANGIGINLSGNLAQTGTALINRDLLISGWLTTGIANTGQAAWTHGQNNALNLSGTIQSTGSNLQSQINAIVNGTGNVLSNVVFTTGTQYIVGTKYFIGNTYIDNLFVTGTQTVINTQDLYVADNWITLNATGGARDSAIFISTGFTGTSSTGGVFGFDVPSNTWRFGLGSQQTDLINLPRVASGEAVDLLDSKINTLSGFTTSISGAIDIRLLATGNSAVTHANGIGVNLSGNLSQTGSNLYNVITGLSGQANLNFATVSNLASTGSQAWNAANNNGINLSGNLASTGAALITRENSIGSSLSGTIATTGSNLYILITGLSGQGASNYATIANLATTGSTLDSKINSLSGFVGNVSGGLESRITASGNASISFSNGVGTSLSGNLSTTGSNLYVLITGLSGQANINYATVTNLASTGQQAWNAANNNGINLSGNLTQTGATLSNKIDSLSGFVGNVSGGLEARITATGNSSINHANGIGSIISGNLTQTGVTLLSLITGASKVTSLNTLTGAISLIGLAGIQILTGLGTITISGSSTASEQFFITGIPSGVDNYYINFPRNFAQIPVIIPSIQTSGETIYSFDISETSLSGFKVLFSNNVLESGVFLNVYAIESGGIALGGTNGASVTVTGSNSLSSVDFTGIGGTIVYTQQNKVYISGGAGSATAVSEFHPFFFLGT